MNIPELSIIIPTYNEEKNIFNLYEEIKNNLNKHIASYEILFVNDYSKDNTKNLIDKIIINNNNVKILNNKENIGQSLSLIRGIKIAKSNTICTIDGDGQNNPKDIIKLFKIYKINQDVKLVSGVRNRRKDSYNKILASKFANFVRRIVLGDNCPDTGCSLKIFDKNIFLTFPEFNGLHRFIPSFFEAMNFEVVYSNVDHRKRMYGSSNYGNFRRALLGINHIIYVKKKINLIRSSK